jgi:hypothetical protein
MDEEPALLRQDQADMEDAAERLRRLTRSPEQNALPYPDLLFGLARLLEELSRSLSAGQQPYEHAVDAATEVAHVVLRFSGGRTVSATPTVRRFAVPRGRDGRR